MIIYIINFIRQAYNRLSLFFNRIKNISINICIRHIFLIRHSKRLAVAISTIIIQQQLNRRSNNIPLITDMQKKD